MENEQLTENIQFHINGKLENRIFGKKKFDGKVVLEGDHLPPVQGIDEEGLQLWSEDRYGVLHSFGSVDADGNYTPSIHLYGIVFIDEDFSNFTIQINPVDEQQPWLESEQLMITAPASGREEAIKLSDQLMEEFMMSRK
ncbi:hypothetical protein [Ornithinibacillus halotolerans]|uniref:Uncharacterized protein n=1 Tax=Ornithinibacillus halotolerans TaxID=1274357 RepID=A0A916RKS8_9BACI|nr:hypothetical protein [Ornithinibacillus halotolerans]GGA60395.1 hypothetical protein GCM10008025_00510 [Ornithinibacillus halotolerans]